MRAAGPRVLAFLTGCLLLTVAPLFADTKESFVLDGLQAARRQSGSAELQPREDLDQVARRLAEELARRPHSKRLQFDEPIEDYLQRYGVEEVRRAILHVELKRGYRSPEVAFLDSWRKQATSWNDSISDRLDSIGLTVQQFDDGWVVMLAILTEELDSRSLESADLRAMERQTLDAINDVRRGHGLGELVQDPALARVARSHSLDMARRDYFAHRSPDGREVDDRARDAGITFSLLGENLHKSRGADNPITTAVESWMRSRRHREALLTPEYTRTGVGVAVDEGGELYFSQLFLRPVE